MMTKRPLKNMPDWVQYLYEEMTKPPYFLQKQRDSSPTSHSSRDGSVDESEAPSRYTQKKQASSSVIDRVQSHLSNKSHSPQSRGNEKRSPDPGSTQTTQVSFARETNRNTSRSRSREGPQMAQHVPLPVLERYAFDVSKRQSLPGILKIHASDGERYAVKRTTLTMPHVRFIHRALIFAQKQGFSRFSRFVLTKKKAPGVVHDSRVYYATEWIDGQPANFSSAEQVAQTAYALAQFHEATNGFKTDKFAPADAFDLFQMTQQRNRDLRQMLVRADAKSQKDDFDNLFLSLKSTMLDDAAESLQRLQQADCVAFLTEDKNHPGLCHLDVIPGNCLYTPEHQIHLIDFELTAFAPRALDIAHLLRRSLQLTNWHGDMAYACFLHFNSVRSMPKVEYHLVHALLQFPYLPWRLAHTRYHYYADDGQLAELERYAEQETRRHEFLESLSLQVRNLSTSDA